MSIRPASPDQPPQHWLWDDHETLYEVIGVMALTVQKHLHLGRPNAPGVPVRNDAREPALSHTGLSADDVLGLALEGLCTVDIRPDNPAAYATTVARNRSIDEWRRNETQRRNLQVVHGDERVAGQDDAGSEVTVFDTAADTTQDPESEALVFTVLRELAAISRELLSDRDVHIYWDKHSGATSSALASRYGLTPRRVRDIYNEAQSILDADPEYRRTLASLPNMEDDDA